MLRLFAWAAGLGFMGLACYSNLIFADVLAGGTKTLLFWQALAVASAVYSAAGWSVLSSQIALKDWGRTTAAAIVLASALAFDALSAYGVSRAEQFRLDAAAQHHEAQRASLVARANLERAALSAYGDVGASEPLRAVVLSLEARITAAQCAEAIGPNKLTTADATRIRDACGRLETAKLAYARAVTRDGLRARLDSLEAGLMALGAAPPRDVRTDVLGDFAAWLPVLLLTAGATLGLFAVERPAALPRREPAAPPAKAVPDVPAAPAPSENSKPSADVIPIVPQLRRVPADADGWIRHSQRKLAALCGMSPPRLNRALKDAAAAGAIDLDTQDGTAIRLKA